MFHTTLSWSSYCRQRGSRWPWSLWFSCRSCYLVSSLLGFSTTGASAQKVHGIVNELKAARAAAGEGNRVQAGIFQVHHLAATLADQMMMSAHLRFETRSSAGVRDFARQSKRNQGFEHAIHRSPGNVLKLAAYLIEDLVGGRVAL